MPDDLAVIGGRCILQLITLPLLNGCIHAGISHRNRNNGKSKTLRNGIAICFTKSCETNLSTAIADVGSAGEIFRR